MAYTIKILSHGKTIKAGPRDVLAEKILEAGIPLSLYCSKRGLCGKCFVEIVSGPRPSLLEKERTWLGQKNLGKNFRLACQYKVSSNLEINVPALFTSPDVPILPAVSRSAVAPDPAVKKYYLELSRPDIASPCSLFEILVEDLGYKHLKAPLAVLSGLGRTLEEGNFKATATVYREKEMIAVEPGDTTEENHGLAVDIGTTTLVMDLVDLNTGRTLATEAAFNGQAKRGADVVSRISYASAGPGYAAELRSLVLDSLNQMVRQVLSRSRVSPASVYEVHASGNTTMNHLLLGIPVETLAVSPYHAVFSRLPSISACQAGFSVHPQAKVYLTPNIKSFVGGDITSGLLASRLLSRRGNYLFIDLGTNGEIVLKAGSDLVATSTAAGPAFEGMNISCGMPALPGAVYKAEDAGSVKIYTLGDQPSRGVCGTGLIDLIAIFLERGKISPGGAVRDENKVIRVDGNVALTQGDIRQMQLACAAIKTGMRLMLKKNHLSEADLEAIYIAGAFGNYLNIENSMRIGLLPRLDHRRLVFIGNSSLAGARLILISRAEREKAESLIRRVRYVSLAAEPEFQDYFIKALEFSGWP
jgi:uncharacterized 2Fe-2S/4Fe-4S cluster protein (DUF4445 family)